MKRILFALVLVPIGIGLLIFLSIWLSDDLPKGDLTKLSYAKIERPIDSTTPQRLTFTDELPYENPGIFNQYTLEFWVKIEITKSYENPLLVISPHNIFELELFKLENHRLRSIYQATRFDSKAESHFLNVSNIIPVENNQNTYYLKLSEKNGSSFKIESWEYEQYQLLDSKLNTLFSSILSGILLMIIINIFFYAVIRDKAYLLYIAYTVFFLLFNALATGYIQHFENLSFLNYSLNTGLLLYVAALGLFTAFVQVFLNTKERSPKFHKYLNGYAILWTIYGILTLSLWPIPYLLIVISNLVAFTQIILYLSMMVVFLKKYHQDTSVFYFSLAFITLLVAVGVRILYALQLLPEHFILAYSFSLLALFETVLFSLALADRVLQFQKQRDFAQKESLEKNIVYELEKEFASLLNKITLKLHDEKPENFESIVVSEFSKDLYQKVSFRSLAAVYQTRKKLNILTDNPDLQDKYRTLIEKQGFTLSNICNRQEIKALELLIAGFEEDSQVFVIPVEMRHHEWSCLLLEVDGDFAPSEALLDFLQHYATELVRSLLNANNLQVIKNKAEIDQLTNVYNRGAIIERLERALDRAKENNTNLSIAFIDVDNFKTINDNFGHEAGDHCLQAIANLLTSKLSGNHRVGRFGGDEFLVVMPETTPEEAFSIISKAKEAIIPVIVQDRLCQYSLSIGISSVEESTHDVHELLRYSDAALYESKAKGKNRISVAQ